MLDFTKVQLAVAGGLSYVCAMCENYHRARDMNVPDDMCLARDGCGSPIAGDVFHEYKGPLTVFDKFCFACGAESTHGLSVAGNVRIIGACEEHVELVKTLQPEGRQPVNVLIRGDGPESEPEAPKVRLKVF